MILEPKRTTVAYRCNICGEGIMGLVGGFELGGSMLRLKCNDCGKSEMTIAYTKDSKVVITAPCIFCPTPHKYTLSSKSFFERELFTLDCTYTGFPTVIMGRQEAVEAELERTFLELVGESEDEPQKLFDASAAMLQAAQEADRENEESEENEEDYEELDGDRRVEALVNELLAEMSKEANIDCNCVRRETQKCVCKISEDGFMIYCTACGAKKQGSPITDAEIRDFFGMDINYLLLE